MLNPILVIQRLRIRLYSWLFEQACLVLLPISTGCKVCNILRGMALGMCLGAGITLFSIALLIHFMWGC